MRDRVVFYLTGGNRGRRIWIQSSRKVRTKIVKAVNSAAHRFWRIGIILELCIENKVVRQNSILRKLFSFACQNTWKTMFIGRCRGACKQAGDIWKCRPQQGRVSTNQYLTYQLPWFCPGSGGKGTWARKESGRLLNGWIVCLCTCLAIYLVINLDSLLVLLFKT